MSLANVLDPENYESEEDFIADLRARIATYGRVNVEIDAYEDPRQEILEETDWSDILEPGEEVEFEKRGYFAEVKRT